MSLYLVLQYCPLVLPAYAPAGTLYRYEIDECMQFSTIYKSEYLQSCKLIKSTTAIKYSTPSTCTARVRRTLRSIRVRTYHSVRHDE